MFAEQTEYYNLFKRVLAEVTSFAHVIFGLLTCVLQHHCRKENYNLHSESTPILVSGNFVQIKYLQVNLLSQENGS